MPLCYYFSFSRRQFYFHFFFLQSLRYRLNGSSISKWRLIGILLIKKQVQFFSFDLLDMLLSLYLTRHERKLNENEKKINISKTQNFFKNISPKIVVKTERVNVCLEAAAAMVTRHQCLSHI